MVCFLLEVELAATSADKRGMEQFVAWKMGTTRLFRELFTLRTALTEKEK